MGDKTNISWTRHPVTGEPGSSWNPVRGCTIRSEGCLNCYAMHMAARYSGVNSNGKRLPYYGLAKFKQDHTPMWTGKLAFVPDHLNDPIKWRAKPRMIFVNSMSDLFHERMPEEWIHQVIDVMFLAPMHVYQVLTKRTDVMLRYLDRWLGEDLDRVALGDPCRYSGGNPVRTMPKHMWFGTSVENHKTALDRMSYLKRTPAYVRWLSVEPMIGPVTLKPWAQDGPPVEWVVIGGESSQGGKARPMELPWMTDLIAECRALKIPVFVKQMGESLAREMRLKSPSGKDPAEWPKQFDFPQEYPILEGSTHDTIA